MLLTRKPDSFVINTFPLGVTLTRRDLVRDPRHARNGVVQPDGSLGGTPKSAFVDTTRESPTSASTSPAAT